LAESFRIDNRTMIPELVFPIVLDIHQIEEISGMESIQRNGAGVPQ
jgi:hypothetical protein